MKHQPRILIVEDEPAIAELVAVNLRHNGLSPVWAEDGEAAQREIDAVLPDAILLDWMLPGQSGAQRPLPAGELGVAADLASAQLRKALDAFARLDTAAAVAILKEDDLLDREFDGFVRKLITYMMEDPRTISSSLDLLFLAMAIERIGDHAKNIAEFIIYIVKGADVRHTPMEQIESAVR